MLEIINSCTVHPLWVMTGQKKGTKIIILTRELKSLAKQPVVIDLDLVWI